MANTINWGKIYESTYWGNTDNNISWGKAYADLAGVVPALVSEFVSRVEADGGSVESTECMSTDLTFLVNNPEPPAPSEFDADYQAILDRSTALGYTAPSGAQQTLQNTLVEDLKTAGVWDKLDLFYVFATDGDSDYATLNWKAPSSFQVTKVNSPTFISNEGYQGDGSSSYLNTNFTPSLDSTQASNYNLSAGGYYYTPASSFYTNIIGIDDGNNDILISPKFGYASFFRLNDGATAQPSTGNTSGLYIATRESNTNYDILTPLGTTNFGNVTNTPNLPQNPLTIFKWSNTYGNNSVSVVFFGSGVTSELSDFKTAVDNYIAGL